MVVGQGDSKYAIQKVEANVVRKPPNPSSILQRIVEESSVLDINYIPEAFGQGAPEVDAEIRGELGSLIEAWKKRAADLRAKMQGLKQVYDARRELVSKLEDEGKVVPPLTDKQAKDISEYHSLSTLITNGSKTIASVRGLLEYLSGGITNRVYGMVPFLETEDDRGVTTNEPVVITHIRALTLDPNNKRTFRKSNVEIGLATQSGFITVGLHNLTGPAVPAIYDPKTDRPTDVSHPQNPSEVFLTKDIRSSAAQEMAEEAERSDGVVREARFLARGDLVSAVSDLLARDIVFATTDEGGVERVVLLPDWVNISDVGRGARVTSPSQAKKYFSIA